MENIAYQEKIVAFIDILGFEHLIGDESKCKEIGAILHLPSLLQKNGMVKVLKTKDVAMSSISDSLVFSIDVDKPSAMNKLVKLLSAFMQVLLLEFSLLVRGGLAVGKLYHDQTVVYGPALLKARHLENTVANYPRIVMQAPDFESSILSCADTAQVSLKNQFQPGEEELLTLDWLYYFRKPTLELCRVKLEKLQSSDPLLQERVDWMAAMVEQKLKVCIQ